MVLGCTVRPLARVPVCPVLLEAFLQLAPVLVWLARPVNTPALITAAAWTVRQATVLPMGPVHALSVCLVNTQTQPRTTNAQIVLRVQPLYLTSLTVFLVILVHTLPQVANRLARTVPPVILRPWGQVFALSALLAPIPTRRHPLAAKSVRLELTVLKGPQVVRSAMPVQQARTLARLAVYPVLLVGSPLWGQANAKLAWPVSCQTLITLLASRAPQDRAHLLATLLAPRVWLVNIQTATICVLHVLLERIHLITSATPRATSVLLARTV